MMSFLDEFLPRRADMQGSYIEPFLGSAAVFLHVSPKKALLSDLNQELIDLYEGIRANPRGVWHLYQSFGSTKDDYLKVRGAKVCDLDQTERAARLLFLNRTCFKGNWRHNLDGAFNVGYGGQSRRWVITEQLIDDVAATLEAADLKCIDFEETIDQARAGDFIFVDPPYKPAARDLANAHYGPNQFRYTDHQRLAGALQRASGRNVHWCMTTSSHADIFALFQGFHVIPVPPKGKRRRASGEILVVSEV